MPGSRSTRLATALLACLLIGVLALASNSGGKSKPDSPTTTATTAASDSQNNGIDHRDENATKTLMDTPVLSADGHFVAFASIRDTLVDGDTNGQTDVFVQDLRSGKVERVSVATDGTQGDAASYLPSISADGRFVSFASNATTFTDADTAKVSQVYLHDRSTGVTTLVSTSATGKSTTVAPGATQGAGQQGVSDDGTRVVWEAADPAVAASDAALPPSVYVTEVASHTTTRLNVTPTGDLPDADAYNPVISGDGTHVAFDSRATNLVSGDRNGEADVFLVQLGDAELTRVSVRDRDTEGNGPSFAPSISGDGTRVAFQSGATNLADHDDNKENDVFVRDLAAGTTTLVSATPKGTTGSGRSENPHLSRDGLVLAFTSVADDLVANDANKAADVFFGKVRGGALQRASVRDAETEATGWSGAASLNADGTLVSFMSDATNLPDARPKTAQAFLFDSKSGKAKVLLAPGDLAPHDSGDVTGS